MAPVDVNYMAAIYIPVFAALTKGKDAAITAALNVAGIPDEGFVGWIIGIIFDGAMGIVFNYSPESSALTIAITLEYAKRNNSYTKAFKLKNKCSECGFRGHNTTNHSKGMSKFLADRKLSHKVLDDANSIMDATGIFLK